MVCQVRENGKCGDSVKGNEERQVESKINLLGPSRRGSLCLGCRWGNELWELHKSNTIKGLKFTINNFPLKLSWVASGNDSGLFRRKMIRSKQHSRKVILWGKNLKNLVRVCLRGLQNKSGKGSQQQIFSVTTEQRIVDDFSMADKDRQQK